MEKSAKKKSFAFHFSLMLLLLVVLGFGSRAVFLPEYWPPVRLALIVHIVVMAVWFFLVVTQSLLINRREVATHMHIGQFGQLAALLVVVTGSLMIIELNLREFNWIQVVSNTGNMVTFAIFFGAAMVWRKDRVAHMRMILFASLALMTPALARLFQPFGAEALAMPAWFALMAIIAVLDIQHFGSLTKATWLGLAVSILSAVALVATLLVLGPEPPGAESASASALHNQLAAIDLWSRHATGSARVQ
ncbi:hypothetical protein SLH49_19900 [Cognatiyoonia sp. IB215446]|uniref:hypothetical protein n=1 Tax=Cognatiyoonia sp. IB215446 TaxID=3097355 RepID=UPI002A13B19D|nr:hypothetical protein [Cognatiyoonia sp. IB215446]MDX8350262.1 hypothetical protein [Cognatiyoonia sp. IB215446]